MAKVKTCTYCSCSFEANHMATKYCSGECKRLQHLERARKKYVPKKVSAKNCEWCNTEYTPSKYSAWKQRFCSNSCSMSYRIKFKIEPSVCSHCGKEYIPKKENRRKYCSRECYFEAIKSKCKTCSKELTDNQKGYCSKTCRPLKPVKVCECSICGAEFEGRNNKKYCSKNCVLEKNRKMTLEYAKAKHKEYSSKYTCKECGIDFEPEYGSKRRSFCGYKCSNRYKEKTESSKEQQKQYNKRRRAAKKGLMAENINIPEIYNRDKWICGICGKRVNKKLKYPDYYSATLDHKVPISKGGTHTEDNVQLAHFICNSRKGNNNVMPDNKGQLMLV